MSWRRGLAALIWGAVVLVAIQLVPTTARAHIGHLHGSGMHASSAHVAGSVSTDPHLRAPDHTARLAAGQARVTAELASAGPDDERGAVPACQGGCCASGCPCCVPMTLAEPEPSWPPLSNALDVIVPAPPTRAGIDPEAPAKPPKSLS
jgi:hypothetical protein